MLGYPINEIAWLVLLIIAGGVVTGVLAGLFGIGGGGVIVPVLYEVFGMMQVPDTVRMQLCIGTSLAIIVPTTVRSYLGHKKKGAVIPQVIRIWTLPAIVGVVIGSVTACFAPSAVFKLAFCVFAGFISAKMLFAGDRWNVGKELPERGLLAVFGFITGLMSSLVGVSGGALSNAVLTLYGQPMQRAVATSAGIGVPITIVGTVGYAIAGWPHVAQLPPLSVGFVSLIGFVLMAPVSSYTTAYGVRLAHWLPRRKLEIGFGIFLMLVSLRFLAQPDLAHLRRRRACATCRRALPSFRSRLRKLMPSRLCLSSPACATSAGTARSVRPPTASLSRVTGAARVRPLAVSTLTV